MAGRMPDTRPRVGPRQMLLVPRAFYAQVITGTWDEAAALADQHQWERQESTGWMAPAGFAAVYEGRPGEVWLCSQGW